MMRRPFGHPMLQERAHIRLKKTARIGVAGGGNGPAHAAPLGDHKLETAAMRDTDAHHGNGTFFDTKLDARAGARLAVVLHQAAKHRLAVRDVQVMRSVMADENEAFAKIDGVEFGEAAADIEPVWQMRESNQAGEQRMPAADVFRCFLEAVLEAIHSGEHGKFLPNLMADAVFRADIERQLLSNAR